MSSMDKKMWIVGLTLLAVSMLLMFAVVFGFIRRIKKNQKDRKKDPNEQLKMKVQGAREIVAPDGVNPNPLSYFVLHDAGHDIYVRCFTIDSLPKRTVFASTFPALMNFSRTAVSVFIEPMTEGKAEHMLDTAIMEIETNIITAENDSNRNMLRKLNAKLIETESWANRIETGENSLYHVYFLFTLMASSLEQLNYESDSFRSLAKEKQIIISACYAVHSEAYFSGMPLNSRFYSRVGPVKVVGLKRHTMDKLSLSSIYNHTQTDFIHENGVILGRNMNTWKPVSFDCYDTSHNGYNIVFCGMTGTGKSATMKILASRYIAKNRYRFLCIDSQAKGNRGEYAMVADVQCGVNYQVKIDSNMVLNPFELHEEEEWSELEGDYVVLRLKDKIEDAKSNMMILIQGGKERADFELTVHLERIVTDVVSELYEERQIFDGDIESLYEPVSEKNGMLSSGKVRKALPTLTDFYKKILIRGKHNEIEEHKKAYRIILDSLKDRVKELYYCPGCLTFYSRNDYSVSQVCSCKGRIRAIRGVKSYYDGQSTVQINKDARFTNIDISQLPDHERAIARLIALSFATEQFIKRNAINPKKTESLGVICDELHENLVSPIAVQKLDYVSRTSRKRLVSLWTATQALKDYDRTPETVAMLTQAAVKFVFKQDYQDKSWIKEALNLTSGQVERIMELGGDPSDDKNSDRKGEVCIVDNGKVCFCKVDYLKSAEAVYVETDARYLQHMYGGKAAE